MKNRLTHKETFLVAIMLFGMFFGEGNLIFPAYLGRQAGSAVWPAIAGLLVTGVGLPRWELLPSASPAATACLP